MISHAWAQVPISNITTSKFTFNGLVTALREQLQLNEEKKSRDPKPVEPTLYQRYGRDPEKVRCHSMKNPIGRDGKRMLCNICGADEHLARAHKSVRNGGTKAYARNQLANGKSAVHVLHELAESMDKLHPDYDSSTDEYHETGHAQHESSELDMFNDLDAPDDGNHAETIDQISATYHVAGMMSGHLRDIYTYPVQRGRPRIFIRAGWCYVPPSEPWKMGSRSSNSCSTT